MSANGAPPPKHGFRVTLSLHYDRRCSCGRIFDYSQGYDAEFCRACDRWWAKACSDPRCEFCATRPARPSLAPDLDPAEREKFNPPRLKVAKRRANGRL